jgi:hypothetical protein
MEYQVYQLECHLLTSLMMEILIFLSSANSKTQLENMLPYNLSTTQMILMPFS